MSNEDHGQCSFVVHRPDPGDGQRGMSSENRTSERPGRTIAAGKRVVVRSSLQAELLGMSWGKRFRWAGSRFGQYELSGTGRRWLFAALDHLRYAWYRDAGLR